MGLIGDDPADCYLESYCNAGFAGDLKDRKSTSGVIVLLVGPSTRMPLLARSVKQTAVSHSTPEAEIIAADLEVRTEAHPLMSLWETH